MTISNLKVLLLALSAPLLMLAGAPVARAADPAAAEPAAMELQAPPQASLGDRVTVTALLRDTLGAPVPGASVTLYGAGSFLSTGGSMPLGSATTDPQGRAAFVYEARIQGATVLTADFSGDGRHGPASASVEIAVAGTAQLYAETAGAHVPGVGVWLLVAVLGGVWSTYLAVVVFLTLIAREPAPVSPGQGTGSGNG